MGFAIVHSLCLLYPLQLGLQKGCYPTGELKQKRKTYGGTKKEEEKQEKIWSSALCLLINMPATCPSCIVYLCAFLVPCPSCNTYRVP